VFSSSLEQSYPRWEQGLNLSDVTIIHSMRHLFVEQKVLANEKHVLTLGVLLRTVLLTQYEDVNIEPGSSNISRGELEGNHAQEILVGFTISKHIQGNPLSIPLRQRCVLCIQSQGHTFLYYHLMHTLESWTRPNFASLPGPMQSNKAHETVVVVLCIFLLNENLPDGICAGHLEVEKAHDEDHKLISLKRCILQ
jgi:hypothetical protein